MLTSYIKWRIHYTRPVYCINFVAVVGYVKF